MPSSNDSSYEAYLLSDIADIDIDSFFKKLLIRLVAGVGQWDATNDVVSLVQKFL